MEPFTKRVIKIIRSIPPGRVLTYGLVAALAGDPRGARQVARVLHSMSRKHGLPWHRVINFRGGISLRGGEEDLQRTLLEAEGVEFGLNGRIDLSRYLPPPAAEIKDL
jgi:methylated-DNA-protein-cysteine methyltransferase-like protein